MVRMNSLILAESSVVITIITAITGVAGATAGALAAWAGVRRSAITTERIARERAAHELELARADRQSAADQLRTTLQRETLLSFQDALARLGRAASKIHLEDVANYRQTGTYGREAVGDVLAEESRLVTMETHQLRVRIADDELRWVASEAMNHLSGIVTAKSQEAAQLHFQAGVEAAFLANERIGVILRHL